MIKLIKNIFNNNDGKMPKMLLIWKFKKYCLVNMWHHLLSKNIFSNGDNYNINLLLRDAKMRAWLKIQNVSESI